MDDTGLLVILLILLLSRYQDRYQDRVPTHGSTLVNEALLSQLSIVDSKLFAFTGLRRRSFHALVNWLRLQGLENSPRVTVEERLAIFLYICRKGASFHTTADVFGRAVPTVSRCFYLILSTLQKLFQEIVRPPPDDYSPLEIRENPKRWPFFKNCIGAVDGTHIRAYILKSNQAPFINRKGIVTQNVFAACTFDLKFTSIVAGWEGSAHDASVLKDAIRRGRFHVPAGKYYLADAGYHNSDFLLVPYLKTRYHLEEWRIADNRPETHQEIFNLRHSGLRSAVERIFGIVKRKWAILDAPLEIGFQSQIHIVHAIAAIHNFIVSHGIDDDEDFQTPISYEQSNPVPPMSFGTPEGIDRMDRLRDGIAKAMWNDYRYSGGLGRVR